MCDKHQKAPIRSTTTSSPKSIGLIKETLFNKKAVRAKLWSLDYNYHCALIGTCLTLTEVKKLLHSCHINYSGWNAYVIHSTIVTMISYNDFRSKKVQSYLDKKFSTLIKKTKKMDAEALTAEWKSVLDTGDLVGTFWAIMSHSNTTTDMRKAFYGDIHMLSHLSGASNRVDLKRLNQLEKERLERVKEASIEQDEREQLKKDNVQLLSTIKNHKSIEKDLKYQLTSVKTINTQLVKSTNEQQRQLLEAQITRLQNKSNAQENEIKKFKNSTDQLTQLVENLNNQQFLNESEISIHKEESEYLQYLLNQQKERNNCQFKSQNLCGQCVLYVGGKKNLIPFYRDLVEEKSGVFLHHDGGEEKNTQDLSVFLSRADIVIFPSDCISHNAFWKIKKACKKQHKPLNI